MQNITHMQKNMQSSVETNRVKMKVSQSSLRSICSFYFHQRCLYVCFFKVNTRALVSIDQPIIKPLTWATTALWSATEASRRLLRVTLEEVVLDLTKSLS